MRSPLIDITADVRTWTVVAGLLLALASGAVMARAAKVPGKRSVPPGKLPGTVGDMSVTAVLTDWGTDGRRSALRWYGADCLFAIGYGVVLALSVDAIGAVLDERAPMWLVDVATAAVLIAAAGALADIIENTLMMVVIAGFEKRHRIAWFWAMLGAFFSRVKQLAVTVAALYIIIAASQLQT